MVPVPWAWVHVLQLVCERASDVPSAPQEHGSYLSKYNLWVVSGLGPGQGSGSPSVDLAKLRLSSQAKTSSLTSSDEEKH